MTFKQEKGKVIAEFGKEGGFRVIVHEKSEPGLLQMLTDASERVQVEHESEQEV